LSFSEFCDDIFALAGDAFVCPLFLPGGRDPFSQNRGLLEEVAGELLKKEVMDSDGFYRLADNHRTLEPPSPE
jgi:hypothetical protein